MRKYACQVASERVVANDRGRAVLRRARAIGAFGLVALIAPGASAHIQLIDPPARYLLQGGDNGIKSCPCGLGGSNRVCNVAADGSDPDRSERVSRFEAGSTIMLRFQEFVNHAGRFRVAFDPDGADMADFNDNILNDVQDPANASGMMWEIPVTLPNMTCDNCTLQLVQAMEVDQNTPIADPAPISSYYACVDIQLVAPATPGDESVEPPNNEQPGDPGTSGEMTGDMGNGQPDGMMAGGSMGDAMTDDTTDDGTPGEGMPGEGMAEDSNGSGSRGADSASSTPLIPVGSGAPMDSSGSTGSTSTTSADAVAMAGMPSAAVLPGAGMARPLPDLSDPNAGASSSGCSLPASGGSGSAVGWAVFGLFALLGSRRERSRHAVRVVPS